VNNRDTTAAWTYHDGTKHSVASVRRSSHVLEWEIMPNPFKVYLHVAPIPLPRDSEQTERSALATIADNGNAAGDGRALDLATLAHLFYFTAGVLHRHAYPGRDVFFRAQACTGNLHHIDLYLICGALPDLAAGVYHFSPHDFALRRLRAGDFRAAVVGASGAEPAVAVAQAIIASTSTFWRNAWKYQARTYRHCFWDDGTLLANLLAVAAGLDVPAHLVLGFVDDELNRLLGLDTEQEVTVSLIALGRGANGMPAPPPMPPLGLQTVPLSEREVGYPVIRAAHAASSLVSAEEVTAWRATPLVPAPPASAEMVVPLPPSLAESAESSESVIARRGSTREFTHAAIEFETLATLLRAITRGISADFVAPGSALGELYLIANAVDGLAPGAYVLDRVKETVGLLRPGDFRNLAGHLDLGQALAGDAAVNIYWLVDLHAVLARYGNRGYRAAQLEAAIGGGKAYLASFALGLGATGLTFFDDDVIEFFSPHAAGKSVMFLMAVGHATRRRRR